MEIINNENNYQIGGTAGCAIACAGGCLISWEILAAVTVATYAMS